MLSAHHSYSWHNSSQVATEADDVEKILSAVEDAETVQTLLFSATMPHWVKDMTRKYLKASHKMVDLIGDSKIKAATTVRRLLAGSC
jgi:ATP-dependent RNA helicase DDX21